MFPKALDSYNYLANVVLKIYVTQVKWIFYTFIYKKNFFEFRTQEIVKTKTFRRLKAEKRSIQFCTFLDTSDSWKNERFRRRWNLGQIYFAWLRIDSKVSFEPIKLELLIHLVHQNQEKVQK